MLAQTFRILNLCWSALMTAVVLGVLLLNLPTPGFELINSVVFWAIYLLLALGTFFDFRVAWLLCLVQLVSIWLLMGLAVSDHSFGFLTGQSIDLRHPASIAFVVFNSFVGVLLPATLLLVLALFSREHLTWVLKGKGRRRDRSPAAVGNAAGAADWRRELGR